MHVAGRGVTTGPRPDVDRGDVGAEGHAPSDVTGPTLPVGLLGVEEEPFVEGSDLLQCLPAHQQHRADHEVDPPAQGAEADSLHPGPERGGERPSHPVGPATGPVHLPGGDARQSGGGPQDPVQPVHVPRSHSGVGVQQEHVVGGRSPVGQAQVDAPGEPEVAARVDVAGTVALTDRPDIGTGGVVHHQDGQRSRQRTEAGVEELGRAEGHHHHLHRGGHRGPCPRYRPPGPRGTERRTDCTGSTGGRSAIGRWHRTVAPPVIACRRTPDTSWPRRGAHGSAPPRGRCSWSTRADAPCAPARPDRSSPPRPRPPHRG